MLARTTMSEVKFC